MVTLKKFDDELQIVYGEVYAPGVPDAHGDFMTEDAIREMGHRFLKSMRVNQIDTNHNHQLIDAVVVESFIARKGDPDFIEGSWVAGVHIADEDAWGLVKSGELNGFSLDGAGKGIDTEIEIEVPEFVLGETSVDSGHNHRFKVFFDKEGNFIGGRTEDSEGHTHKITKGTVTDTEKGHSHRFSFVEVLTGDYAQD